jgi:DNA-directed RNA polymerase subunit RPC12/RpoP
MSEPRRLRPLTAFYETECGKEFCTLDDEQLDSSFVFCSFCGKRINVKEPA